MCVGDSGKCLHNRAFVKRRCIDSWEGGRLRIGLGKIPTISFSCTKEIQNNTFETIVRSSFI